MGGGEGHMTMEQRRGDSAAVYQGMPRMAGGHQKLTEARKGSSLGPSGIMISDFQPPEL